MKKKMTFALCFCNRGFMPGELIYGARDDMVKAVTDAGYDYIMMDKELTRYGGVETRDEGLLYAKWLKEHEGQYDGVIFSMPIFADENGAITALQDAGVPILMQAYPDEIGKMDFAHRRDAYCGKFSVTDVFCQYNVPFTVLKPHVVHPLSAKFQENLRDFAAICRVVNGMKRFNLGCIGARTTAFKTVRFDEVAMQKNGINVESFDLSEVFEKVRAKADDDAVVLAKLEHLKNYTDFSKVPASNALTLAKVSVVLDEYIEEYHLDALALRCWNEMETYLRICPCVLLSELNDRGIVASCEIDMCSAISMRAMSLASEGPAAVLDWNNNYGDDEDKIILFHCGPVAQTPDGRQGQPSPSTRCLPRTIRVPAGAATRAASSPCPSPSPTARPRTARSSSTRLKRSSPTIPSRTDTSAAAASQRSRTCRISASRSPRAASSTTLPSARAITRTSSRKRSQPTSATSGSTSTANCKRGLQRNDTRCSPAFLFLFFRQLLPDAGSLTASGVQTAVEAGHEEAVGQQPRKRACQTGRVKAERRHGPKAHRRARKHLQKA